MWKAPWSSHRSNHLYDLGNLLRAFVGLREESLHSAVQCISPELNIPSEIKYQVFLPGRHCSTPANHCTIISRSDVRQVKTVPFFVFDPMNPPKNNKETTKNPPAGPLVAPDRPAGQRTFQPASKRPFRTSFHSRSRNHLPGRSRSLGPRSGRRGGVSGSLGSESCVPFWGFRVLKSVKTPENSGLVGAAWDWHLAMRLTSYT